METTEATLARPPVVSQTEWDAALTALLERERNVAAAMHELAAARKRMPMVRVERDYAFEGPDGRRSLPELFDGRSQLILYRFFFEEGVDGWPDAGCVGCSSFADGIPELGLLHSRDITFAMASPAPQANLQRYAERMGWTDVPWYTICTERFSADFGVDEWFGLNIFLRDGKDVYRTYFLQHGAMVQFIGSIWSMWSLDALRRPVRRRGVARGLAAGAAVVLVPPPRRVRRAAAVGPPGHRRGRSTLAPAPLSCSSKDDVQRRIRGDSPRRRRSHVRRGKCVAADDPVPKAGRRRCQ